MHVSRVFLEERISEGLRVKLSRPETCNGRPVIDAPVRLLSLLRKWLSGSGEGNYNFCFMCGSLFFFFLSFLVLLGGCESKHEVHRLLLNDEKCMKKA